MWRARHSYMLPVHVKYSINLNHYYLSVTFINPHHLIPITFCKTSIIFRIHEEGPEDSERLADLPQIVVKWQDHGATPVKSSAWATRM
jgi:hypothetical protein